MNKFSQKGSNVLNDKTAKIHPQEDKLFFPPKDDQISLKEVAELFGTTPQTVINWRAKGKLPYFQLSEFSRPIYSRSQLIKLASKNQHLIKH